MKLEEELGREGQRGQGRERREKNQVHRSFSRFLDKPS